MPILHIQLSGAATGPERQRIQIPSKAALAMRGPIVQVSLSVPPVLAAKFSQEAKPVPNPIAGLALIDTGASGSCVDDDVARKLQLPVVNVVKMASASHAATDKNVYPLSFDILGGPKITVYSATLIGAELAAQGLVLLIGRDILANACLFYNGLAGQVTFSI